MLSLFPFALSKRKARALWIGGTLFGDFSFALHEDLGEAACHPRHPPAPISAHAPRQSSAPLRRGHARGGVAVQKLPNVPRPPRPRLGSSAGWSPHSLDFAGRVLGVSKRRRLCVGTKLLV